MDDDDVVSDCKAPLWSYITVQLPTNIILLLMVVGMVPNMQFFLVSILFRYSKM